MTRRRALMGALLMAAMTRCELPPRLYLSVRTEVGSPVRRVTVQVFSPPRAAAPLPDGTLERSLAPGGRFDLRVLARVGGERVRVLVDGYEPGTERARVHQDWIASLPTEGGGYLQVVLWNTCIGNDSCVAGESCASDGTCMPNDVGPAAVSLTDGGALGACPGDGGCGARPDAGRDATVDAPMDATVDASTTDRAAPLDVVASEVPPRPDAPVADRLDAGVDAGVDAPPTIDRSDVPADLPVDAGLPVDRVDAGGDVPADGGRCPGPSASARPGWTRCGSVWCPTACDGPAACMHLQTVSLGRDHGCALRADRRVVCWGAGGVGALGDGTMDTTARAVPVEVRRQVTGGLLTGMQSIFADFDATCGVDDIGELVCWGAPGGDPLRLDFEPSYTARSAVRLGRPDAGVDDNRYTLAAATPDTTCAVTRRGGVRCRSRIFYLADGQGDLYGDPATYPLRDIQREEGGALAGVTALGLGYYHACAALGDGSVWCWGTNRSGQLGRPLPGTAGGVGSSDVARRVGGLTAVTSIAVGDFFTCVLAGADVRCWGLASYGRVGTFEGTTACADANDCAASPVSVGGLAELVRFNAPPAQIAAAAEHACVRLANGGVWCWGYNGVGELGLPTTGAGAVVDRAGVSGAPVFEGADDLVAGGSGGGEQRSWTCARRASDCTWWCWGRIPGEAPAAAEPWRPRVLRWAP